MVDSKTLKISVGKGIVKDPEMLRLVPDHLKTVKMGKDAIEKLPFVIKHVPDRYKLNECVIKLF